MQGNTETAPNTVWIVPVALAGFALVAVFAINPVAGAVAAMGLAVVTVSLFWPEAATLAVVFALYMNIMAVAAEFHHVPKALAALVMFLLFIPLFNRLIVRGEKFVFDRIALLMVLYLVAMLFSTIFARSIKLAVRDMADYLYEGLLIYLVVVNVVRELPTLKRAILVILLAGSVMGALSTFQHYTHTLDNNYGGFAQTGGVFGVGMDFGKQALEKRSNGPIGEKNHYAQVLTVLLPLAYFMFWHKKRGLLRWAVLGAAALIFGGIVFSYSRGALLGIAVVVLMMIAMRYIKARQLILAGLAAAVLIVIMKPQFVTRMATFQQMAAMLPGNSHIQQRQIADESMRGRLAQNLAALEVFRDHPLVGVGPAHFARFYSTPYVNRLGLIFQEKGFFAHNMYLQIAAETGVIGLVAFLAIGWVLMSGLWRDWKRLRWRYPDLADISAAFLLGFVSYFVTAIFLQLAYQRYFWLLVALGSAAMHLVRQEEARRDAIFIESSLEEIELTNF